MSAESTTSFGERLRRLREAAGLTQEELAERAGLTRDAIGALERGLRRRPYPHTLRALSAALGLSDQARETFHASVRERGTPAPAAGAIQTPPLPAPPTGIIGRERETAELRRLLLGDARLLTLTGPGGVGKTRLALEVASDAAQHFPDGVAFVALAPLADPASVVPAVARVLGVRDVPGQPLLATLGVYLSERRLLLVLDNFEHLLDAAPDLADLLGLAPALKVFVTARAPLRLRGEREYPVRPLALPDLSHVPTVDEVADAASVQLFAQRARDTCPGFGLTPVNAPTVAAICQRLEGLPLAIELAASRIKLLPPMELLARLDRVLPLLVGGARDLPERQRTMASTIGWSHDLLDTAQRSLFRRLSVFAGGWTLEAAEAVSGEDALVELGRLVDHSLVAVETDADVDAARYRMLEPIRHYALEQLEQSGERDTVRGLHARYFLALAERAAPELNRAAQARWLARLESEHDNLRTALDWFLEQGDAEDAVRLGWYLHRYWWIRGHLGEGQRWAVRALARGAAIGEPVRALACLAAAHVAYPQGKYAQTASLLDEAIPLLRAGDDALLLAHGLALRGYAALGLGQPDAVVTCFGEALAVYRRCGTRSGEGITLNGLGAAALFGGDGERAYGLLRDAEAALRAAESPWDLAINRNWLAMVAYGKGEYETTEALLRESFELLAPLRDTWTLAYNLTWLAGVAATRQQALRAARLFGAAQTLREATGATIQFEPTRILHERQVAMAREQLDAAAFAAAWEEGRAMTVRRAVAYALEEDTTAG